MAESLHRARLSYRIGGTEGWYRASCPQLDVYGAGASPEKAKAGLFEAAKLTARYVVGLNGKGDNDPRKPYAEIIVAHWSNPSVVFDEERD